MNKFFISSYLLLPIFIFIVFANIATAWPIDCAGGYDYRVNAGESARCQTTYLDNGENLDGGQSVLGTKDSWTGTWYCDSKQNEDTYYCCKDCTYPTNGICGLANGVAVATSPTTQLCTIGTPSNVSTGSSWTWSCSGIDGGTSASCSAPKICTYIEEVTEWSTCSDGMQYATEVEYATSTTSCTDVPISRSCTNSTCFNPNTSQPVSFQSTLGLNYPGLTYYWKADETSGTVLHDSKGTKNGTLLNGSTYPVVAWGSPMSNLPTFSSGKFGNALSLDGINDYVELSQVGNATTLSLGGWFYSQNDDVGIIFSDLTDAALHDFEFGIGSNNIYVRADKDQAILQDSVVVGNLLNSWNHIVWQMEPSVSKLYVNGELKATINKTGKQTTTHAWTPDIGRTFDEPPASTNLNNYSWNYGYYKGKIDDLFYITGRVLSECEIKMLAKGPNACNELCSTGSSCGPASPTASIGQSVLWSASSTNGTAPYTYTWTGEGLSGMGETKAVTYLTAGIKNATTSVVDSSNPVFTQTVACSPLTVYGPLTSPTGFSAGPVLVNLDQDVSLRRDSCSSVLISWNAVDGATGYILFRGSSASTVNQQIATLSSGQLSYEDSGLVGGNTYYYAVQAKRGTEISATSTPDSITLDACIMGACGTYGSDPAKTYYEGIDSWPTGGTFCINGSTPSESPISFPATEVNWVCVGNTGGINPTCIAQKSPVPSGSCEITQTGAPSNVDTFYINKNVSFKPGNVTIPGGGGTKTYTWYEQKANATRSVIGNQRDISRLITSPVGNRTYILEVKTGSDLIARCEKTVNFIPNPGNVQEQ